MVLFGCSMLFLIVVLSLGYFISVTAKSQLGACQMALLATFLPTFLLSGFIFPIDQMPVVVQWITRFLPARYYVSILRNVFLKGTEIRLLARRYCRAGSDCGGSGHAGHSFVSEEAGMRIRQAMRTHSSNAEEGVHPDSARPAHALDIVWARRSSRC